AIEGYTRGPTGPGAPPIPTFQDKIAEGLVRANLIFSRNELKGIARPLGELGLWTTGGGPGGTVTFGNWFEDGTSDPNLPPCADYPCFRQVSNPADPAAEATAVQVVARNEQDNLIVVPFANALRQLEVRSTAIIVPRCFASILDISYSAV